MINRFDSKHKVNLSSNQTLWERLKMFCFCSFYTFGENISLLTFKPLMQLHRGFKARYVTLAENFTTTMCSRTVRARHVDFQLTHRKNCTLRFLLYALVLLARSYKCCDSYFIDQPARIFVNEGKFSKQLRLSSTYTLKFVFLPKCLGVPPRELLLGVGPKLIIADIFEN